MYSQNATNKIQYSSLNHCTTNNDTQRGQTGRHLDRVKSGSTSTTTRRLFNFVSNPGRNPFGKNDNTVQATPHIHNLTIPAFYFSRLKTFTESPTVPDYLSLIIDEWLQQIIENQKLVCKTVCAEDQHTSKFIKHYTEIQQATRQEVSLENGNRRC